MSKLEQLYELVNIKYLFNIAWEQIARIIVIYAFMNLPTATLVVLQ